MIVKADIGFSNKNAPPGAGAQQSFWSAMTDTNNMFSVPLLSLSNVGNFTSGDVYINVI